MAKIEINLSAKKINFIEETTGDDVSKVIQRLTDDWFSSVVNIKFKDKKTLDEKIDIINK